MRPISFILLSAAACAGCAQKPPAQQEAFHIDREVWPSPHSFGSTGSGSQVVTSGGLPLVYQVLQGGAVRVADATTGRTLAEGAAKPDEILSVTARGITLGDRRLTQEPLPGDHEYAIYREFTLSLESSSGVQSGPTVPRK